MYSLDVFLFMLDQLFGSKIRVKLLQLFLANPDNKYYIRELTRLLDSQINSIRREVENLASFGIVMEAQLEKNEEKVIDEIQAKVDKSESQKKYFKANKDFPLFRELKSLMLRSHLIVKNALLKDILKVGNIQYLALTGIFIENSNSPVDILIVGKLAKDKLEKIISNFEKELNRSINYTLMSLTEFKYRMDITDRFLYEIMDGDKVVILDKINVNK